MKYGIYHLWYRIRYAVRSREDQQDQAVRDSDSVHETPRQSK